MRATSRTPLIALMGALIAACLGALGCQQPMAAGLVDLTAAPRPARQRPEPGEQLSLPARQPSGEAPRREPALDSSRVAAADPPEIIWRASPHGVNTAPAEAADPVVPASFRDTTAHRDRAAALPQDDLPRELNKVTLPPYRIEPPDLLLINALRTIPRPPGKIEPLDELAIQAPAAQVIPNEPIAAVYPVGSDGTVDLGFSYGKVPVAGLTPEQARSAISKHVSDVHGIKPPSVSVALKRTRAMQQIHGEHLVRMDGTVSLSQYGEVYVAGLTLPEAKQAVEAHLSQSLLNPDVTVELLGCKSKVYYVIFDGGCGDQVFKLPLVGGETVLDAISEIRGLALPSSPKRVWVARPVPGQVRCRQLLPVDWAAITRGGATKTNYQIFPGDRIVVEVDRGGMWNNAFSKLVSPFHRLFGCTPLGNATSRTVSGQNDGGF